MMTDTPRYPNFSFGNTVGELSGEFQRPPESLRKGRKCMLLDSPMTDEAVLDKVVGQWVEYLEPRRMEHYLFDENFSVYLEDDEEDYETLEGSLVQS